MDAVDEAIERRTGWFNDDMRAGRQQRNHFAGRSLTLAGIGTLDDQDRGEGRNVVNPSERDPQRHDRRDHRVVDDDVFLELCRGRVQQLACVDRLIPWFDLATLNPLFLFDAQFGEFLRQDFDVLAELPCQRPKLAFMFTAWQLDDGHKCFLLLAILALGFLPGLTLLTLLSLAFLDALPALLFSFALLFLAALFLIAILTTAQLTAILLRLLLLLRENSSDCLLELLFGGVEFLDVVRADQELPVALRQRRHSRNFGVKATRLFFVADGKLDDLRRAVLGGIIGHGLSHSPMR